MTSSPCARTHANASWPLVHPCTTQTLSVAERKSGWICSGKYLEENQMKMKNAISNSGIFLGINNEKLRRRRFESRAHLFLCQLLDLLDQLDVLHQTKPSSSLLEIGAKA